ncbi:MAG TPA: glycosyltransferase family 2 protein [Patescibacteria group bacterium]|nr:glycosyltransferase family 2 protein [Patescibacteria group bacterium]
MKKKNSEITAVIPTYTNISGLRKLILTLSSMGIPSIIVDNQPTQEKEDMAKKYSAIYLPQLTNRGFGFAVNRGVERVNSQWIVILNDDIEIQDKRLFERMLDYAEKNNFIAVSPVLKKPNGNVENLGYKVLPFGRVELIKDVTQNELDGLTAACLLIKKAVFSSIGGFDERFFAYLEDVDLFLKLKRRGEKFGICLEEEAIHNHMTTSSRMGNFKEMQDVKNWYLVIFNNWNAKTMIKHFPSILLERIRNLSGLVKKTVKVYMIQFHKFRLNRNKKYEHRL